MIYGFPGQKMRCIFQKPSPVGRVGRGFKPEKMLVKM